ncbi:uncharacterized protein LOC127254927 [Andrographis paniculata]|uniref:uncharacterized protein LOC127254927 n=1 Tax=Andrographis paniculata TaxID=175694 RepID=UPI0021E950CD|nr:uncharacterized protein LOC127254927 [Andrographis paniculata]XP_051136237.1 uncharacterized protein LOC127254927 [Andrographis paniculata]
MGGAGEDWVKAAMADDAMVVEVLVRLQKTPPRRVVGVRRTAAATAPTLPLRWSVRQRRSKSISVNNDSLKKPAHRASPTTPLSWSGATSVSGGGGGGSEECSRFKFSSTARSKVNIDTKKTNSRRSRKKTLPELKEEEISLMKERKDLRRELIALRKNLESEKATNEKLKRMKIELQPHLRSTSVANESTSHTTHDPQPVVDAMVESSTSDAHPEENRDAAATSGSKFVLPDLNMPFDGCSGVICGVS